MARLDLVKKVEEIKIKAKKTLESDGYHKHIINAFRDDEVFITSVPTYNTYEEKEKIFKDITISLKSLKIKAFIYIFESWMVKKQENKELDTNILPSQHPDKIETLCIIGKTKTETYGIFIPFIKLGKRIIFEKEEIWDSSKGFTMEDNLFKGVFE